MPSSAPPNENHPERAPPWGLTALAPLQQPVFRLLWLTWLAANVSMWMNDVAAAWMMTALTTSPVWVALVQTAATLPVFLLGLPSGALADTLDRRRFFLATQLWVAAVAVVMVAAVQFDALTPPLLLALVFANGIGLALRWPVFAALVPDLVPRQQLPQALALNGVSMNASRIIGPLLAGAIIATLGSAYVFALNAVLALVSAVVIWRWRYVSPPDPLGREPFWSAMRVGWQFVHQSSRLRVVFVHVGLFFFHSTALVALLPLLALRMEGGHAGTFTVLLAAMGSGAIVAALFLPRLRERLQRDQLVLAGVSLQSAAMLAMALAPSVAWALPAMFIAGMAWISTANTLSVSAQWALPNWVRARGMSMYQMAIMGGSGLGAAFWGKVAHWSDIHISVAVAACSGLCATWLVQRWMREGAPPEDLTPVPWEHPQADVRAEAGPVLTCIEYHIEPQRRDEFLALMRATRRSRLRLGARSWALREDLEQPGCFVEEIIDDSWTEHLRRFDRVSGADLALREQRLALHQGTSPPKVRRYSSQAMAPSHSVTLDTPH